MSALLLGFSSLLLAQQPAGAVAAQAALASRCSTAGTDRVIIDGLTGLVTYPAQKVFKPGDVVTVGVRRANLVQYRYTIKLDSKEALVAHYEVAGIGSVEDLQKDLRTRTTAETPDASGAAAVTFGQLQDRLLVIRDTIGDALNVLSVTERELNANLTDCAWPATLQNARTQFLSNAFANNNASYQGQARLLRQEYIRLARGLTGDAKTALESAINDDLSTITDLLADLEKARNVVDRWNNILLTHPIPYIEQSFLIEDVSNRNTVSVTKAPVSAVARAVETADNTPASGAAGGTSAAVPDPVLATATFEGHALSRLGVTLGLAGIAKPDERTFDLVRSIAADNTVQINVRETKRNRLDITPIASILVYTSPIDNLNPKRKPQFLLTAGTEVSSAPKTFVAGFGWDFPSGLVITAGVTRYMRTELAKGWVDGQAVPLKPDGTPIVDAVPTRESGAIGGYVGLQFRPAIFKAFWKLVTPVRVIKHHASVDSFHG